MYCQRNKKKLYHEEKDVEEGDNDVQYDNDDNNDGNDRHRL